MMVGDLTGLVDGLDVRLRPREGSRMILRHVAKQLGVWSFTEVGKVEEAVAVTA